MSGAVLTMSGAGVKIATQVSHMPISSTRSEKLDLRLSAAAKQTLRAAAAAANRTVSDFVLESAMSRAAETLADRQRFGLDSKEWRVFQAALDAPTRSMPKMHSLLNTRSVFEAK
jgi:uncharacterized protein (DUF1778 family)